MEPAAVCFETSSTLQLVKISCAVPRGSQEGENKPTCHGLGKFKMHHDKDSCTVLPALVQYVLHRFATYFQPQDWHTKLTLNQLESDGICPSRPSLSFWVPKDHGLTGWPHFPACQATGHIFSAWVASKRAKTPALAEESTKRIKGPCQDPGPQKLQCLHLSNSLLWLWNQFENRNAPNIIDIISDLCTSVAFLHETFPRKPLVKKDLTRGILLSTPRLHQSRSNASIKARQTALTVKISHSLERMHCWSRS